MPMVFLLVYGLTCFVVSLALGMEYGGAIQLAFLPVAIVGGAVLGRLLSDR